MNIFNLYICILILLLFFYSEHKFNPNNQKFFKIFVKKAPEKLRRSPLKLISRFQAEIAIAMLVEYFPL